MSARALLLAVRDQIRTTYTLDEGQCDLMDDGQPPPRAGELFVAVHPAGSWQNAAPEADTYLRELFGFHVTVSVKLGHVPVDRKGRAAILDEILSTNRPGVALVDRCERLAKILHLNYTIMAAANVYLQANDADREPLVKPPRFEVGVGPMKKSPDWWHLPTTTPTKANAAFGLSCELRFGRGEVSDQLEDLAGYALPEE